MMIIYMYIITKLGTTSTHVSGYYTQSNKTVTKKLRLAKSPLDTMRPGLGVKFPDNI